MAVKIAACQVPEIRADIEHALTWINKFADQAQLAAVDLLCFPECFLQGYINDAEEEVLARQHALNLSSPAFDNILKRLAHIKPMLVIGLIEVDQENFYNTAVVVSCGKLIGQYRKNNIGPGEHFFQAGTSYPVFEVKGLKFGINICRDTNFPEAAISLAEQGADLIVCPANNLMPYEKAEKNKFRHNQGRGERAKETGLWLISSDIVNERDGRISYGPTAIINPQGAVVEQVPLGEVGMVAKTI